MDTFVRISDPINLHSIVNTIDDEYFDYVEKSNANFASVYLSNYAGVFCGLFNGEKTRSLLDDYGETNFIICQLYPNSDCVCVWSYIAEPARLNLGKRYLHFKNDQYALIPMEMYAKLQIKKFNFISAQSNDYKLE